jgi:hypothetical protein
VKQYFEPAAIWAQVSSQSAMDLGCFLSRKPLTATREATGANNSLGMTRPRLLLVSNSGIRWIDPERGRKCDEMILFLHQDIAKALSDGKFIELV